MENRYTLASTLRRRRPVLWLTVSGVLMALNILLSMSIFSIPVPGGHLYLNDAVILIAAVILDPLGAFLVGGLGAFLGDLLFYPAPMFVSLLAHGLEALLVSLLTHRKDGRDSLAGLIGAVASGALVMTAVYTVMRPYVYGTWEQSMLKLPYELCQGGVGAVVSVVLLRGRGLEKRLDRLLRE